jgi:hypothetical protein
VKIIHQRTVGLALCASLCGTAAKAQTGAKPYPAVFGAATRTSTAKGATIDITVEAADAYDDNLQAEVAGSPENTLIQASGYYTSLAPSVAVDAHPGRAHIVASGGSNVRYYGDLQRVLVTGHSAAFGVDTELNRKTRIFVNQAVSYAPAYLHGLFAPVAAVGPGTPIDPASDYAVDSGRSLTYATTANLTRGFGERIDVTAEAAYRRSDFSGSAPGYLNLRGYEAGSVMRYTMNRNLKMRFGYTYHFTEYGSDYHPQENNFDIGFEYTRALSALRRTTFAFSLGPAIASGVSPNRAAAEDDRQYRIGGEFSVNHQLTRTWSVRGSMRRGLAYVENVSRPVVANAASVGVQGYLGRRADLSMTGGYTTGELALVGTPPPFSTYTSVTRLRYAFARHLAVFGEYLYYYYHFNPDFPLPPGVASTLTRNGVRAGVALWIPAGRK